MTGPHDSIPRCSASDRRADCVRTVAHHRHGAPALCRDRSARTALRVAPPACMGPGSRFAWPGRKGGAACTACADPPSLRPGLEPGRIDTDGAWSGTPRVYGSRLALRLAGTQGRCFACAPCADPSSLRPGLEPGPINTDRASSGAAGAHRSRLKAGTQGRSFVRGARDWRATWNTASLTYGG